MAGDQRTLPALLGVARKLQHEASAFARRRIDRQTAFVRDGNAVGEVQTESQPRRAGASREALEYPWQDLRRDPRPLIAGFQSTVRAVELVFQRYQYANR